LIELLPIRMQQDRCRNRSTWAIKRQFHHQNSCYYRRTRQSVRF